MTPYERARGLVTQLATVLDELSALPAVMRVLDTGAIKYPDRRWLKQSTHEHMAHAFEHGKAWLGGTKVDAESGESNLAHFVVRGMFALAREAMKK